MKTGSFWRIFGPKKNANGECRKLHNKESYSFYHSTYRVKVIKSIMGRSCSQKVRFFKILTVTTIGKRPLGTPRCRWEENITWILKKSMSMRGIVLIRLRIRIIGESL